MFIISVSHKTAPVHVREVFSFTTEEQIEFINGAVENEHISECILVSTCNRCEVYFNGDKEAVQTMQNLLADFKNAELELFLRYFLIYQGERAIHHLFQVTCGMESMVKGEDEILGQVKEAYQTALSNNTTKYLLNTLFQAAITCAKRVKTDTRISKTPISLGTLVANEILAYPKEEKTVLIIGMTGKIGSIIMKNLYGKRNITIIGTSRSHNTIEEFGKQYKEVKMIDYQSRYQYMDLADIVISATKSPHYTITCHELAEVIHTDKERLFLDLSVPVDIDKNIKRISRTKLRDIDFFEHVSAQNLIIKEQESDQAQCIIEEYVDEVKKEILFREFIHDIPMISKVVEKMSLEGVLFEMKNKASSDELKMLIGLLRKIT